MEKTYYIQNPETKMVLDVKGSSKEKGADVIVFPYHGGDNQLWKSKDGMLYSVNNEDLVLDIDEANKRLCVWTAHGGPNQMWTSDGASLASHTGFAIDIAEGSKEPGAKVIPFVLHGGPNQEFVLIEKEEEKED